MFPGSRFAWGTHTAKLRGTEGFAREPEAMDGAAGLGILYLSRG
jgi:hypothetical protein